MFRGTQKAELSPKNFGAGSLVAEGNRKYLVVADGCVVRLVRMDTFELTGAGVAVEDPNFLSQAEADTLIAPLQVTRSDCDLDPKGLKG